MRTEQQQPVDENARLEELLSYEILDTPAERSFDEIAALAARLCNAPIAFVTLVDRNREWFKATFGVDDSVREVPRKGGFCATAILAPHVPLVVQDATVDPRFADNPAVTGDFGLRFYAGVPIVNQDGFALGTLSVVDTVPRTIDAHELEALSLLTSIVADQLELHRLTLDIESAIDDNERLAVSAAKPTSLLAETGLASAIAAAPTVCDRLGNALRAASADARDGNNEALIDLATRVTATLQDLLLSLSHIELASTRANSVAEALRALGAAEQTH